MQLLSFSKGNAKLSKRLIFSLPAGYTCRQAGVCKTFANRTTGKIIDRPDLLSSINPEYRCFAAMAETRPNVRDTRWSNWSQLKTAMFTGHDPVSSMAILIKTSLAVAPKLDLTRIHESGDFWSEQYFLAWCQVAASYPDKVFYAFTKELQLWLDNVDKIPNNFYLTASAGGKLDALIPQYPDTFKRVAYVVYTEQEAIDLGLEIDHDDSHCFGNKPFALLLHGVQRKGTEASKALSLRKKNGAWIGYNTKNKLKP